VYERAKESAAEEVVVATDDERIADVCRQFGAEASLTQKVHHSGTDRIAEVLALRAWPDNTIIVNLQGDEPCMPAALIDQVARDLAVRDSVGMATLAHPIRDTEALFDPHVVKVVTNDEGYALYFSRAPLPWHRDEFLGGRKTLPSTVPFLRHIGLYAYRADFLNRFVGWVPAPLELAESLEQLRVLWHGERIHVTLAGQEPGPGVDTPSDIQHVLARLQQATSG
jgi:3-deoxy-manno-octulosonate cytidylyltransferase (CMP-KDO synthetase)